LNILQADPGGNKVSNLYLARGNQGQSLTVMGR